MMTVNKAIEKMQPGEGFWKCVRLGSAVGQAFTIKIFAGKRGESWFVLGGELCRSRVKILSNLKRRQIYAGEVIKQELFPEQAF